VGAPRVKGPHGSGQQRRRSCKTRSASAALRPADNASWGRAASLELLLPPLLSTNTELILKLTLSHRQ
jgi:hypothetical protein